MDTALINADSSLRRLQEQSGGQMADGTVGLFVREREYSELASAAAGEPVYVDHDYCLVRVPANAGASTKQLVRKTFPDGREVITSDWHIRKYSLAWEAFLRGEDLRPPGTLLEDCPAIPRSRLQALRAVNLRTVEELVTVPDGSLRRVGQDARALQKAARDWLESTADADKDAKMAALAAELAELKARLNNAEAPADGNDQDSSAERSSRSRAVRPG